MPRKMSGVENRYVSEIRIEATAESKWYMLGSEEDQCPKEYDSIVSYWDDTMTWPEKYVVEGFENKSSALDDAHTRLATIVPAIKAIMLAAK